MASPRTDPQQPEEIGEATLKPESVSPPKNLPKDPVNEFYRTMNDFYVDIKKLVEALSDPEIITGLTIEDRQTLDQFMQPYRNLLAAGNPFEMNADASMEEKISHLLSAMHPNNNKFQYWLDQMSAITCAKFPFEHFIDLNIKSYPELYDRILKKMVGVTPSETELAARSSVQKILAVIPVTLKELTKPPKKKPGMPGYKTPLLNREQRFLLRAETADFEKMLAQIDRQKGQTETKYFAHQTKSDKNRQAFNALKKKVIAALQVTFNEYEEKYAKDPEHKKGRTEMQKLGKAITELRYLSPEFEQRNITPRELRAIQKQVKQLTTEKQSLLNIQDHLMRKYQVSESDILQLAHEMAQNSFSKNKEEHPEFSDSDLRSVIDLAKIAKIDAKIEGLKETSLQRAFDRLADIVDDLKTHKKSQSTGMFRVSNWLQGLRDVDKVITENPLAQRLSRRSTVTVDRPSARA